MLTEIMGDPGSLYLTGVLLWIMALTCSVRKAFFSMPNPFLTVHRSLYLIWLVQQEKRMMMAVVEMRNQTIVWHQGAHRQGD